MTVPDADVAKSSEGKMAKGNMNPRCRILVEYAKWTALSAVRSGCPIKAKKPVYRLLDGVAFSEVLDRSLGPISCKDFNEWHTSQTEDLCDRAKPDLSPKWVKAHGQRFPVGWGAKLINVFLKTAVYAGGLGCSSLMKALHPPLDNGIKKGCGSSSLAAQVSPAAARREAIGSVKAW